MNKLHTSLLVVVFLAGAVFAHAERQYYGEQHLTATPAPQAKVAPRGTLGDPNSGNAAMRALYDWSAKNPEQAEALMQSAQQAAAMGKPSQAQKQAQPQPATSRQVALGDPNSSNAFMRGLHNWSQKNPEQAEALMQSMQQATAAGKPAQDQRAAEQAALAAQPATFNPPYNTERYFLDMPRHTDTEVFDAPSTTTATTTVKKDDKKGKKKDKKEDKKKCDDKKKCNPDAQALKAKVEDSAYAPWAKVLKETVSVGKDKSLSKPKESSTKGLDQAMLQSRKGIKEALAHHSILEGYYVSIIDLDRVGLEGVVLLEQFLSLSPAEAKQENGAPQDLNVLKASRDGVPTKVAKPPFYKTTTAKMNGKDFKTMEIFLEKDVVARVNPRYGKIELFRNGNYNKGEKDSKKTSAVYYIR